MTLKVLFKLENNEDGYPPISHELINVTDMSNNTFRIDNAPFFVRELSFNDIVFAQESDINEQFEFVCVKEESSFTSISIIILAPSMDSYLMDLLRGLGCVVEYGEFGSYRVLAVAIPAETDYFKLKKQLNSLEEDTKISFEELAIAHQE